METTLPTMPQVSTQVVGKTFGKRAAAYIIDTIAIYLVNQVTGFGVGIVLIIAMVITGRKIQINDQSVTQGLSIFANVILYIIYFSVFEWLYGATLGKLILGMRVVKENGEPCDIKAALIRAVLRYVDGFFFALPAYLNMKAPLNQRIGDKSANTIVVDSKDAIIQQHRSWKLFLAAAAVYIGIDAILILFVCLA
jgi:uncharacterized RDD family membrane protein YckC